MKRDVDPIIPMTLGNTRRTACALSCMLCQPRCSTVEAFSDLMAKRSRKQKIESAWY